MAFEKVTIVDRVEIDSLGDVSVRLKLMVVENGETVLASRFHRTVIPLGTPPSQQMQLVNEHLAMMGEPPVDASDLARLESICELEQQVAGRKLLANKLFRKPVPKV